MKHSFALWSLVVSSALTTAQAAPQGQPEQIEQSSWFADVSHELERAACRFSPVQGEQHAWSAPNRAYDFRSRVSVRGVEVVPRDVDDCESGANWKLTLATKSFGRADSTSELNAPSLHVANERVELDHGPLIEWFVNDERGLEQGWTIARAPVGAEPLWIGLDVGGDLSLRIDDGGRSGVFVDATGEPRLRYTGLIAFDATGRDLEARLTPGSGGVGIAIDDTRAIYPLTVDPVLTGPAWTVEGDFASGHFGWSAATAGDVNGDGYSDVIVGAFQYFNDEPLEGHAFVYLGSDTGLATSASWTAQGDQDFAAFGSSVATAGDVNGDGYSDVIVGAQNGLAFVYLGSDTGLSSSPAWTSEAVGSCVATAGDVNGDGYSDVIVGAPEYDNGQSNEGRAFVYLGSAAGLSTTAAWTAESDQADSFFGWSVATAGDVNGDGYSDVIVGSDRYDNGQVNEGRAFVYLGSGAGLSTVAAWTAESDQNSASFGRCVATAGDVNSDGYSDVIVGAWRYDNGRGNEGRAFVYCGSGAGLSISAAWTAESDQAGASFGQSVATAGDMNGDGYSDVIVGAGAYDAHHVDEGRAFVYLGGGAGLGASAEWTVESDQAGALLGSCVGTAGDVNGDGYSDLLAGAPAYDNGETDEGRVFVYAGAGAGLSIRSAWTAGNVFGTTFGRSVATAGDVNGDGYSDVIVGGPVYDPGGRAFVYLGSSTGLDISMAWSAASNQDEAWFGDSVASAGDVNGDGYSDVIVGSYRYDNGQANEGCAFVYLGSSTGLATTAAWTAESDQDFAALGNCVASAGDVNGDGYGDVVVGAYAYDLGEANEGAAFVYLGSSAGLAASPAWSAAGDHLGFAYGISVASAGDVNGDGYGDVIVGARDDGFVPPSLGQVFVYLGSNAGLSTSAAWTAGSPNGASGFGDCVATAGDVNGDGYSDVIVSAEPFQGEAYVYLGSSSGLGSNPAWTAESDQVSSSFAISVATAGDVNRDGYSDVIVGANGYDNGEQQEGRAFVYMGSSTGLAASPAWTAESNQETANYGWSVATAGDVNGDGYSDVIVGTSGTKAYVYLGNDGRGGWTLAAQQRRADDTVPIDLLGRSNDRNEFRIHLAIERELAGFAWASGLTPNARLEWEVKPLYAPLDGSRIGSGAEQTITGELVRFDELVEFHAPGDSILSFGSAHHVAAGAYHWRARLRTNNPVLPVTPWVTVPWNNVTETKLRAMAMQRAGSVPK